MSAAHANRPAKVRIVDVGPRDGLQNEKQPVSTADKVALINALGTAGVPAIEAGAFVSPKWVPQMADTPDVLATITRMSGVSYPVLVPNLKGWEAAQAATGVEEIAVFGAASESFSQRNINCSIEESLERFRPVISAAKEAGVRVRGYVSCVVGCPYEGAVDPGKVALVASSLHQMGCYEISLGDTIGVGTPDRVRAMLLRVADDIPMSALALHFHDTYGQALANILACLEEGAAVIDSSTGGLGGCPYAKGATGNVATEDVLYLLEGLGIETGIDLGKVVAAAQTISAVLGRAPASRVANALSR